jgi:membrane fusion protein (multidrug efflux system)
MKKSLVTPILLVVFLASCGKGEQGAGAAAGGMPPPPEVDVVTVTAGSTTLTQDLPGRLEAWRTAQVRARVEGIIEKRLFAEGSNVKAGSPLFKIDDRTYKTAAAAADADVAVAKLTVDRYRPLLEIKAVSQQEFDQAEAKLKQTEAVLAKAKLDQENANVLAPISGRIGRALVTEGALVGKAEATQLATIEQIDPIYANVTESNTDLLRLRQAVKAGRVKRSAETRVQVVMEDGSIYPHPGKLLFSDLAVDPNTGSILIRAEIPNPEKELLPGMFVRIRFPESIADNAITLPQRAVQMGAQGQFVMTVDKDGKATPLPVKVGGMSGGNFMIADGLKGGEQVIVNGLQKARPGSTVKPVPWNTAAAVPTATAPAAPAPAAKQGN